MKNDEVPLIRPRRLAGSAPASEAQAISARPDHRVGAEDPGYHGEDAAAGCYPLERARARSAIASFARDGAPRLTTLMTCSLTG